LTRTEVNLFVIDDDESIRISLGRLLRAVGFECAAFSSAEEFLASLRADDRGCAIIDVHMPGMNGVELMQVLRGSARKLGIILMTAFDDPEAREHAAGAGLVILRKPFDDLTLLAAIDQTKIPTSIG
jgi:FixJ family two-component response regulator